MKKFIFIFGIHKTYTSTLVCVLNSDPNTHILYEHFNKIVSTTNVNNINKYVNIISDNKHKNIGDKIILPKLDKLRLVHQTIKRKIDCKFIYPVVDVTQWVGKFYSICVLRKMKPSKWGHYNDYSKLITNYVLQYLYCLKENMLIIKKFDTDTITEQMKKYCNLNIKNDWYKKNTKNEFAEKRTCCRYDFKDNQNKVVISKCKFWNEVLPIFYKYYRDETDINNIDDDMDKLVLIAGKYKISNIQQLYSLIVIKNKKFI